MKVNDLSKELSIKNKELIDYLKSRGYKISSHMQAVPDEAIDDCIEFFKPTEKKTKVEETTSEEKTIVVQETTSERPKRVFAPDDMIRCHSVVPWKLNAVGVDRTTVYHWDYFGDEDLVSYRDLQSMRRKEIITTPKIVIDDLDLVYQWRRELEPLYRLYLGVEYPEEFFDKSDDEFKETLEKAPDSFKEVIKVTATEMIRNENYPTVQKLNIIDSVLGTCLKEFL